MPFMAVSNFKLPLGIITSHLDACTSVKYAHPSYTHIIFDMSCTHCVKFKQKIYPQTLCQCILWYMNIFEFLKIFQPIRNICKGNTTSIPRVSLLCLNFFLKNSNQESYFLRQLHFLHLKSSLLDLNPSL